MRRATITLPDDLASDLDSFLSSQDPAPSLTRLVQTALRRFLDEKRLERAFEVREFRPAQGPLRLTIPEQGSGESDVSVEHDRYLTDDE